MVDNDAVTLPGLRDTGPVQPYLALACLGSSGNRTTHQIRQTFHTSLLAQRPVIGQFHLAQHQSTYQDCHYDRADPGR